MRIKIQLPQQFIWQGQLPVSINHINYGGHMGNDAVLQIAHEARMRFLAHYGFTETNIDGAALIMADCAIQYRAEAFYGDTLNIAIAIANVANHRFDLFYKIERPDAASPTLIAKVKTGMAFYNYTQRKVQSAPQAFLKLFAT